LNFLDFDHSEDPQGGGSFDAMASVGADQLAAVRAEIAQVLAWAQAAFPGMQAPLEEGGEWDFDLQEQQEQQEGQKDGAGPVWHVLTLSLSGSAQFCADFRQRFVF
jgi:hypothetical protein